MAGSGSPQRLSFRKKLAFSLLALGLTLFGLELGWRVYLYWIGRGFFDDRNVFTSPFFTTYSEPMPTVTPEQFVFHRGRVSRQKPANEIRIIAFGGSTTLNRGAGISYTDLLEERFAADTSSAGYRVRVLNAGSEGFSTAHSLVNFALRNLDVRPDVITVYHNVNDLNAVAFGVTSDYGNKYRSDFYLDFRHRVGVLASIARVSRLSRYLFGRIHAVAHPAAGRKSQRDFSEYRKGLTYFRRNLRTIAAIAKAHGVSVVMASQAGRSNLRNWKPFAEYNEAIRQLALEESVPFVDVAAMVTDDDAFLDAVHNNRKGVEMVADAFYPTLRKVLLKVRPEAFAGSAPPTESPLPERARGEERPLARARFLAPIERPAIQ